MAKFSDVPIVDIHDGNFQEMWPSMLLALRTSTFVALDLELSGLGNRKMLTAKSIDDRYATLKEVARTRSVLSIGISCFKVQPSSGLNETFLAQNYNITLLCSEDYVVEPSSVQFLVDHGFDFNKQYSLGVPYYRGNDRPADTKPQTIRQLISQLIMSRVPVIFHNGLIDLIYLYQNFYAELPSKFSSFISDLSEIFQAGIYDTKYLTDFVARFQASYLEYTFRKCHRENAVSASEGKTHVFLHFPSYPSSSQDVKYRRIGLPHPGLTLTAEEKKKVSTRICHVFAAHGWCPSLRNCQKSHNIDLILDCDGDTGGSKKRKRNRNRKKRLEAHTETEGITCESTEIEANLTSGDLALDCSPSKYTRYESNEKEPHGVSGELKQSGCTTISLNLPPDQAKDYPENSSEIKLPASYFEDRDTSSESQYSSGGHRAGFDAFMTGFVLAKYAVQFGETSVDASVFKIGSYSMDSFVNKMPLSGKDIPLQITKSSFSKTSKDHQHKTEILRKQRENFT